MSHFPKIHKHIHSHLHVFLLRWKSLTTINHLCSSISPSLFCRNFSTKYCCIFYDPTLYCIMTKAFILSSLFSVFYFFSETLIHISSMLLSNLMMSKTYVFLWSFWMYMSWISRDIFGKLLQIWMNISCISKYILENIT